MASSNNQLRVKNRGGFLTAHIIGQPYGEMDPKFVKDIYEELQQEVTIFNRRNRRMKLQYNGSITHPLFVYGWSQMRNYYGINGNKIILMTYVGRSRFVIDFPAQHFIPQSLPSFHTYRHYPNDTVSFNVKLTSYLASGSQLTLKKDFGNYIRTTGFNNIILYGPQGDEINCKVLIKDSANKHSTKIGKGWLNFVKINGFVSGDIINFKFVNKQQNNIMKVMQI